MDVLHFWSSCWSFCWTLGHRVFIHRRSCLCLWLSSCYDGFYCGRFLFRQVMVVQGNVPHHRTNTAQKWLMELSPKRCPGLWNPSHPDPVKAFTMQQWHKQKLTAHMTPRIHHRCPGVRYQRTRRQVPCPFLWPDNVRAVLMAFKSHTRTHAHEHCWVITLPCLSCFDLQVCSVGKRTTAALKDLQRFFHTFSHTRTAHTYLQCRTELVPTFFDLMTPPQAFHSFCSTAILVQPALFVPPQRMCLPHLQTSINPPICSGNSHNTGELANSWLTGWTHSLNCFVKKEPENFVCLFVFFLLVCLFFAIFCLPA